MKVDHIRAMQHKRPFQPFAIVQDTGEAYRVDHPEQITLGETYVFWGDGFSRWSFFGPENVTEVRSVRNGASRRK